MHRVDRLLDELGRVVDDVVFEPLRKPLGRLRHGLADVLGGGERVRARALEHRDRDRRIEVEIGVRRIVQRRPARRAPTSLSRTTALAVCLTTMLANCSGSASRPSVCTAIWNAPGLSTGGWLRMPEATWMFWPCSASGDVVRGHAERLQAVGIEPDPHRIVAAAEHDDRADAVDAGQRVLDLERGVVGDEQRVARLVGRQHVHDHHQVGRGLGDGDADVAHVGRQARQRGRDAVLHLHLRDIEVGAEIEGHADREAAVAVRVRRHVEHVLDAVDLLLDRRHHGRGDHLGAGAGILARYVDDRRRDLGILRDRQAR